MNSDVKRNNFLKSMDIHSLNSTIYYASDVSILRADFEHKEFLIAKISGWKSYFYILAHISRLGIYKGDMYFGTARHHTRSMQVKMYCK